MAEEIKSPSEALEYQREEEAMNNEKEYENDYKEVTEEDSEILENFKKHSSEMDSHWDPLFNEMAEDWDVYTLDQWTENGKRQRGRRPKVTVDISRKFVKSVVAETFKNPPGVRLTPRSERSSTKAKRISEAIRYFEDQAGAIYAYSWAKECASVCGIGWLKVSYNFDEQQEIPAVLDVERIDDPLSVKIDPSSIKLDGSDALFAVECHGKEGKEEKYTYWWKDEDGIVKWALICGTKIEDKGVFPTTEIPIVPVYGEVYNIRGKAKIFGMIRQLRDTQRSYNFIMSEAIERIAITPKTQIKAVPGAIPQQYMKDWARAAVEPVPVLWWNNLDENGQPTIPEPSRENTTPDASWVPPMLSQLQTIANETTGIFPDSYGSRNSAESGRAIEARMEGSDRGQLVYDEHLQVSIKQIGRLMLSMLDEVITPAGLLPVMEEDGSKSSIEIGPQYMATAPNGLPMLITPELPDLDVSELEVSVSAAPAYATRKAEGLDKITSLLPSLPPEDQKALVPQLLRDMQFPGSDKYANVLQPDPEEINPVALQQQLMQAQEQMEQLSAQNQELNNKNQELVIQLNNNTNAILQGKMIDGENRKAVEAMKIQGKMAEAQMKIEADSMETDKEIVAERIDSQEDRRVELAKAMAQLDAEAESDNKELAARAMEKQAELLSKLNG